jgi:hypothetical protein
MGHVNQCRRRSANLIDAAQQNASSLANVADTVGTNLDVTA